MKGLFITFEGIDGAGKSSVIDHCAALLHQHDIPVIQTREPGGTALAEQWRRQLLGETMDAATEALLAFAARSDHIARRIRPSLQAGIAVLSDRFTDSSYAYQGGGRQLGAARIEALEQWLHADLQPDRTYLFDLEPKVAADRIARVRTADRFERESSDFFRRVRAAYLERARRDPDRFRMIRADRAEAVTRAEVQADLEMLIHRFVAADDAASSNDPDEPPSAWM